MTPVVGEVVVVVIADSAAASAKVSPAQTPWSELLHRAVVVPDVVTTMDSTATVDGTFSVSYSTNTIPLIAVPTMGTQLSEIISLPHVTQLVAVPNVATPEDVNGTICAALERSTYVYDSVVSSYSLVPVPAILTADRAVPQAVLGAGARMTVGAEAVTPPLMSKNEKDCKPVAIAQTHGYLYRLVVVPAHFVPRRRGMCVHALFSYRPGV